MNAEQSSFVVYSAFVALRSSFLLIIASHLSRDWSILTGALEPF
jgi:hypothetical protein